jgi:carbamoyltransferase
MLGVNAYHADASACLLRDGALVAAAEEERFRRVKHWAGFPSAAIRYCLEVGGVRLQDVTHVAVNQATRANLLAKLAFALGRRPRVGLLRDRLQTARRRAGIRETLSELSGRRWAGTVHAVEHHLAHLGSAYLVSPFDDAVVVSVDGFGDFASAAWGRGRSGAIEVGGRVHFPHSLGIFYQAITQYLGFPHYGDEYKVMGLASLGEPAYLAEMRRVVRLQDDGRFALDLAFFRHQRERVEYRWEDGAPTFGPLYAPAMETLLGPARAPDGRLDQRHRDIARSAQVMYEEALFHLLERLHDRYRLDALCLAGGCALNSVANGKIVGRTPFTRLYVQAAAGDAGGALGAALVAWTRVTGGARRRFRMDHAYWGPAYPDGDVAALLAARASELAARTCSARRIDDAAALCTETARRLAAGEVVGWFQGRMEWGPRALGNRSILADPRYPDMKDHLNATIKRREPFRPFAASVLREAVAEWFEADGDVPFMTQVYLVRPEKRARVPAVTHVDGSGRLQTVTREANPLYRQLIEAFQALTGVPLLLNTSLNESEPVVCTPEQALDCFLRTRMDALVMGRWLVVRAGADPGQRPPAPPGDSPRLAVV